MNDNNKNSNVIKSNPSPTIESKPEIIEKKVYVKESKGRKLISCQSLMSCGCVLILLAIIGIVYIVYAKPTNLWSPMVTFLNDGIQTPTYNGKTSDSTKAELNDQIKNIGDVDLYINDQQLTSLGREKLTAFKNLVTEIKPGRLNLYWDIDNTIEKNPLKGIIELQLDNDNKVYLSKFGTGRITAPGFLDQLLTSGFYSVLNIGSTNKDTNYGFLLNLIPSSSLNIKSITFEEGQMHIKATVKVNLFQ